MKYFKNIELVTKENAYQKMKKLYSNDSDLINKINIDDLQEYITAGCYYLDDITLLDEDSYFEKIKTYINNVDENKIISNIITVGIIDLYNQEGIEGVNNYIEKSNKVNSNSNTSVSTNETFETGVEFNNNTKFYSKGNDIHYGTRDKLIQNGISFTKRKAVKLRAEDYKKYDYIIGMEKSNVINIKRIVGEDVDDKIYRLLDFSDTPRDIADPWYTGNFEITFNDIVEGCNGFLKCLKDKNIIDK